MPHVQFEVDGRQVVREGPRTSSSDKPSWCPSGNPQPPRRMQKGMEVEVRSRGKQKLHAGKIRTVHGDGTVDVDLDSGARESGVLAENVTLRDTTNQPGQGPAPGPEAVIARANPDKSAWLPNSTRVQRLSDDELLQAKNLVASEDIQKHFGESDGGKTKPLPGSKKSSAAPRRNPLNPQNVDLHTNHFGAREPNRSYDAVPQKKSSRGIKYVPPVPKPKVIKHSKPLVWFGDRRPAGSWPRHPNEKSASRVVGMAS